MSGIERREVRPRHCVTHDCTTTPWNPERCQHIAAERDQSACHLVPLFYEVPEDFQRERAAGEAR